MPVGVQLPARQPLLNVLNAVHGLPGVIAAGAGGIPEVKFSDARTGLLKLELLPDSATFTGGRRVAVGDVNADGYFDLSTGPGMAPEVKGIHGGSQPGTNDSTFRAAQAAVAQLPEFTGNVKLVATDPFWDTEAAAVYTKGWKEHQ